MSPVLRIHVPDVENLVQSPSGDYQGRGSSRTQGRRRDGLSLTRENDRYIVTSLSAQSHPGQALYESFYCARGDAENRVKKLKCDLFAEHSSSNLFDANTVRLCLSSFAHVLYNRLRQALAETSLSRACPTTLRLRLLKIGVRVRISARRIHVAMSGSCPDKTSFAAAWKALVPI